MAWARVGWDSKLLSPSLCLLLSLLLPFTPLHSSVSAFIPLPFSFSPSLPWLTTQQSHAHIFTHTYVHTHALSGIPQFTQKLALSLWAFKESCPPAKTALLSLPSHPVGWYTQSVSNWSPRSLGGNEMGGSQWEGRTAQELGHPVWRCKAAEEETRPRRMLGNGRCVELPNQGSQTRNPIMLKKKKSRARVRMGEDGLQVRSGRASNFIFPGLRKRVIFGHKYLVGAWDQDEWCPLLCTSLCLVSEGTVLSCSAPMGPSSEHMEGGHGSSLQLCLLQKRKTELFWCWRTYATVSPWDGQVGNAQLS